MSSAASPSQFRAAWLPKEKGRHEIKLRDTPRLEANEVLVRITATSINPVDWKMRDWGIFIPGYPIVLGSDAAGEIAALGSNVKDYSVGERVFFQGIISTIDYATFQEYAKMPSDLLARTPKSIRDEEASGIGLASMAALVGFYQESGFDVKPRPWEAQGETAGKGKAVVILGGSSSVGQYAIQQARLSGFETIVTNSSSSHFAHLESLGATKVLDRKTAKPQDYVDAARANGHAFAMVFDMISSTETQILGVRILQKANKKDSTIAKDLGFGIKTNTLVTLYTPEPPVEEAVKNGENDAQHVDVRTVWGIGSQEPLRTAASAFLKAVGGEQGWLSKGLYKPNRTTPVKGGLAAVDEACDKNRDGVSGTKVVIRPFDDHEK